MEPIESLNEKQNRVIITCLHANGFYCTKPNVYNNLKKREFQITHIDEDILDTKLFKDRAVVGRSVVSLNNKKDIKDWSIGQMDRFLSGENAVTDMTTTTGRIPRDQDRTGRVQVRKPQDQTGRVQVREPQDRADRVQDRERQDRTERVQFLNYDQHWERLL